MSPLLDKHLISDDFLPHCIKNIKRVRLYYLGLILVIIPTPIMMFINSLKTGKFNSLSSSIIIIFCLLIIIIPIIWVVFLLIRMTRDIKNEDFEIIHRTVKSIDLSKSRYMISFDIIGRYRKASFIKKEKAQMLAVGDDITIIRGKASKHITEIFRVDSPSSALSVSNALMRSSSLL